MSEKNLNARVIHKCDTLENWQKATNFIPLKGEIIIVSSGDDGHNEPRIKVGDGNTKVNNLSYFYEQTTLFDLDCICKNKVPYSINTNDVIYNELGYKNGFRVRSGGAEIETTNRGSCTGYIKVEPGDIIRLSGWDFNQVCVENAINVSDNNFTNLGQLVRNSDGYGIFASDAAWYNYSMQSVVEESTGVWKWVVPPAESGIAYIRITGYTLADGSKMLVTINDQIGVFSFE